MDKIPTISNGRNAIKVNLISDELSNLLGQVLTIIDASTDGEKNKAIKDLVREKFNKKQDFFFELAYKEQEKEGNGHAPAMYWEQHLVVFDEEKDKFSFA